MKLTPVSARRHPKPVTERSAKGVGALKTNRRRDRLDRHIRSREATARFIQAMILDEDAGRLTKSSFEAANEMSRRETGALRQNRDGKIAVRIVRDPACQFSQAIVRLSLKPQRLGVLLLPAGPLQINDQLAGYSQRGGWSQIFLDQRQREIDPGGYSSGSVKLPVLQKNGIRLNLQLRKMPYQMVGEPPVSRHAPAIE
jgi:hypothetical protein